MAGGTNGYGTVFRVNTDGTGYALLKNFSAYLINGATNNDSAKPYGGLVVSGGNLYGTGSSGGKSGQGSIFRLPYPFAIATNLVHNGNGSVTLNFLVGTNYPYVLQAVTNLTQACGNHSSPTPPPTVRGSSRTPTRMLFPRGFIG